MAIERNQKSTVGLQGSFKDKNAVRNCVIFSLIAAAGIVAGFILKNPLIPVIGLLPAAFYEVIRTGGTSTKVSSILLLIVLVLEAVLIVFRINIDIAKYIGTKSQYIAGYNVPLGDIKVLAPVLMAILSVILFIKTAGVYTKWLAAIIFVTSFVTIYLLAPRGFPDLLKWGVQEVSKIIHRFI
jgi:hypothetical protein